VRMARSCATFPPSVVHLYGIRRPQKNARQDDARPLAACVEGLPGRKESFQCANETSMTTTACRWWCRAATGLWSRYRPSVRVRRLREHLIQALQELRTAKHSK